MFTGITLKNYKSFFDFKADFTKSRGSAKNMVLIYGENSIGKSCLVESFFTLYQFLNTRSYKEKFNNSQLDEESSEKKPHSGRYSEAYKIIRENKSIGSKDNMLLKFDFLIANKKGSYIIETNDETIVYEKLEFASNKNIVKLFELSLEEMYISSSLLSGEDENFVNIILSSIDMYWGRHSLLSILDYEMEDKNFNYIKKQFSNSLLKIMTFFNSISIRLKRGNREELGLVGTSHKILRNLEKGTIHISDENKLNKAENLLSYYFSKLYADVNKAYYKKEIKGNYIDYQLFLEKIMYDRAVDLGFNLESTGTQNLLDLLPFFIAAIEGHIIVIDEIDNGIHDLLIEKLIIELFDSLDFKGQAIITTHNTSLMESSISKDLMYLLKYEENKKVLKPLTQIIRIQNNNNSRKKYLSGEFGGIPDIEISMRELTRKID